MGKTDEEIMEEAFDAQLEELKKTGGVMTSVTARGSPYGEEDE